MLSQNPAGAATGSDFGDIVRALAKLRFAVVVGVAAVLPAAPSHAENFAFVSASGSGVACTAAAPCAIVNTALNIAQPVRVICLNGTARDDTGINYIASGVVVDIDCPQGFESRLFFSPGATNATVRIRHLGFRNGGFPNEIIFQGSGTLTLEDCVFTDATGTALDIEPNGPLNLVIRNSRISNSGSGILLKPQAGGSIKATLDHVTITGNGGGGIKADATNGVVNLDVSDSEISNNAGNGINAVGAGTSQNIVSIRNSVIARNGVAGVQSNGASAGVLVATTLLDLNGTGALSVVADGNLVTYGNNNIVGLQGSSFTGTATLK
jgi:hypothetical protein